MPETLGLVLGKFLPPHRGHQYLIDFARAYVDHLVVHVCSIPSEPIDGALRYAWIREQFAGCEDVTVVHNDDRNPQTPEECPEQFYAIWRESLLRRMPRQPDLVFASEPYGFDLAEGLGARYVPVDHLRARVPISGTRLRQDVHANWPYLIPPARPHFARRVAIIGPESSGKTTLTAQLAHIFSAPWASEYARGFLEAAPEHWVGDDGMNGFGEAAVEIILRGQRASIEAMARQCETTGLIFSDTEAIVTACWSDVLLGRVPLLAEEFIRSQRFDLYLVMAATQSWVDDESQRIQPNFADRKRFEQACIGHLERNRYPYVFLEGDWEARKNQAVQAIERLLMQETQPPAPNS